MIHSSLEQDIGVCEATIGCSFLSPVVFPGVFFPTSKLWKNHFTPPFLGLTFQRLFANSRMGAKSSGKQDLTDVNKPKVHVLSQTLKSLMRKKEKIEKTKIRPL